MDIGKEIATRIRTLRKSRGWSQKDLADKIGVIQTHVSKWENGMRPNSQSLGEIAQAFGVSVSDLYTENPQSHNGDADQMSTDDHLDLKAIANDPELFSTLNDIRKLKTALPPEVRDQMATALSRLIRLLLSSVEYQTDHSQADTDQ